MRGHRDAHGGPGVEQPRGQRLEVAVALGLDLEHRRRPAVLAGLHELVIPVGALDQPHRSAAASARTPAPTPGCARAARASRAGRPGAPCPPTARARTRPRTAPRAPGRAPPRASRATPCRCGCGPRARARGAAAAAAARRRRAGRAPARRVAAAGSAPRSSPTRSSAGSRPTLSRSSTSRAGHPRWAPASSVSASVAARRVPVGLGLGDGRLAEQVDRAGHAAVPQVAQHAERRSRRLADDEPVGHVLDPRRGGGADRGARRAVVGHPHRRGERRRGVGHLAQELAQVTGEVVERPAGGVDVDEPEQRGLAAPGRPRPSPSRAGRAPCSGWRALDGNADARSVPISWIERSSASRSGVVERRARGHAPGRMLTARATTSPTVTSEARACALIIHLAVAVSGIVSVGLKAVAFVSETYR